MSVLLIADIVASIYTNTTQEITGNVLQSLMTRTVEESDTHIADIIKHITATERTHWDTAYGWGNHAGLYSLLAHTHAGVYEPSLGNPGVDGYILSSTTAGVRTWISNAAMVYPGAGIPISTGATWGASIVNNSTNWNTAYGWGNHAGLYSLLAHNHNLNDLTEKSWNSLTDKPTTFTPSSHGNGSHSTDLVGEPGVIDAKTEKTTLVDADVAIIEDSADLEVGLKKPKKITWANIKAWLGIDNLLFTFSENDLGNSGASKTVSFGTKSFQKITVTADCTLTLTAPSSGSGRFQLTATQGGVGNFNLIFPTGAGGCVFPQGAFDFTAGTTGQVTIITLLWNGVYWVVVPTEYFNIPA